MGLKIKELSGQVGSVMVEAVLSISFLVMLCTAVYDLGQIIHGYVVFTQIANEGARYASRLSRLETGSYGEEVAPVGAPATTPPSVPQYHQLVHNRVMQVLTVQAPLFDTEDVRVRSTYVAGTINQVEISISARYESLFPLFRGFTFETVHSASYMGRG